MWKKKYNGMTINEYLDAYHTFKTDAVAQYNKELIADYPFLLPRNRFTDETPEGYDYTYSELDYMEDGWRIAFGEELLKDLKEELIDNDFLDKYRIVQIKEKFGRLRWYDNSSYSEVMDKYEDLSFKTCGECGKPAMWISHGWIYPYCEECARKYADYRKMKVEEMFIRADSAEDVIEKL